MRWSFRLVLSALLSAGIWTLWWTQDQQVMGMTRLVRIQGFLPPCATREPTTAEVWFPDEGILYDSIGRPWQRERSGRLHQRPDPRCRYRALLEPSGSVDISVMLTTWMPPRRCTVRFYTQGMVPRIARSLPCHGFRRNLTVQLPTMPLALPLNDAED